MSVKATRSSSGGVGETGDGAPAPWMSRGRLAGSAVAALRGLGRGGGLAPRVDTAEVGVELRAVLGGDARRADDLPRSAGPVVPADPHVVDQPVVALLGVRY